jgi:drug/metabolite transporter (DMT)-like permease
LSNLIKAHIALFGANLIYGINYRIAKNVMEGYIEPIGFIFFRVSGALLLFWTFGLFGPKEKVEKKDLVRLFFCGMFGVAINQMLFFYGLNQTNSINASIIMTTNPILVLIIASILIKERVTKRKVLGIGLGLLGACYLLLFRGGFEMGSTTLWGDLMIFINASSYAVYLVIAKPLLQKYHPITVIKWVFFFGIFFVTPFGIEQALKVDWINMPDEIWASVIFVVVGTTFFAYLLNIFALKIVNPTVASTYLYMQPIVAVSLDVALGIGTLSWQKIAATLLIFAGVYLVSRPARKTIPDTG